MKYLLPSFHFQFVCVPRSEMALLSTAYMGICFRIHSASLCFLLGAFNSFTFKVIINLYIIIAILLITLDLIL